MFVSRMAGRNGDLTALAQFLRRYHGLAEVELSAPTRTLDGMISLLNGHMVYLVDAEVLRSKRPDAPEWEPSS